MKKYSAYLFDMDGTLVNSEKLKGRAIASACHFFGGEVQINSYKKVMGESWQKVTSFFLNRLELIPVLKSLIVFSKIYIRNY